jgi:hypothetical protein
MYNLKGFMVGNGATDWDFDVSPSFPSIAYNFNLVPKSLYDEYTSLECVVYFNDFKPRSGKNITRCSELWNETKAGDSGSFNDLTKDLNWYDLYRPKYGEGLTAEERTVTTMVNGVEMTYKKGRTFRESSPFLKALLGEAKPGEKEYTMDMDASAYFNDAAVKTAMHLDTFNGTWSQCVAYNTTLNQSQAANGQIWNYHV